MLGIYQSGAASGIIVRIEGKARRIRLNESINGWQLQSVQERAAIFTSAGQTRELPLLRAKVGSAAADPMARVPATANAPLPPPTPAAAPSAPEAATPPPPAAPRKSRFGP